MTRLGLQVGLQVGVQDLARDHRILKSASVGSNSARFETEFFYLCVRNMVSNHCGLEAF